MKLSKQKTAGFCCNVWCLSSKSTHPGIAPRSGHSIFTMSDVTLTGQFSCVQRPKVNVFLFLFLQILGLISTCILICRTREVKYDRLENAQRDGLRVWGEAALGNEHSPYPQYCLQCPFVHLFSACTRSRWSNLWLKCGLGRFWILRRSREIDRRCGWCMLWGNGCTLRRHLLFVFGPHETLGGTHDVLHWLLV